MSGTPRRLTRALLRHATQELCGRDRDLARAVGRVGAPPLWARRPGFATLVRIVLAQQVSLPSAEALYARLRDRLGGVTAEGVARLGRAGLRRMGFTRQKADYCHDLAERVDRGELDLGRIARVDDAAGRRHLLAIRGLGPWSVDIYYLMALRRPDVWPHADLALGEAARVIKRLPARPDPERLARLAERWAPWRSVAARILWQYYLRGRSAPPTGSPASSASSKSNRPIASHD